MARRRYVPLSVTFAHGDTGTKILDKFGAKGLLAWVCLIAAAKRSGNEGQYVHLSDAETWSNFGLSVDPPSFTFDEFVTFLGRMRKVSRTRSGRVLYVSLTDWAAWNQEWKTDQATEQKSRKRAETPPDIPQTAAGHDADTSRTEVDLDLEAEREQEREVHSSAGARKDRFTEQAERQAMLEVTNRVFGLTSNSIELGIRMESVDAFIEAGYTEDEIARRASNYRTHFPNAAFTPKAVLSHWTTCDKAKVVVAEPARQSKDERVIQNIMGQRERWGLNEPIGSTFMQRTDGALAIEAQVVAEDDL